jgi:ABC-type Zn uptake system ZnuABC Zn-binding protein ZnuA
MRPPRRRRLAGPLVAWWLAGRQAGFFISALLVIVLPLATARAQAPLRVAATSTDLKALVEAVGGDRVEVDSLAAPDQDPHAIEVKPAQLARLRGAALLVRVGLDSEPWLARLKTDAAVVDVSVRVSLLQAQTPRLRAERAAHVHAYGNPHYWLDPANVWPITEAILEALVRLRPADQARFVANRAAFLEALERRMAEWARMLQPFRGTKLVVIHDSWAYFAERYGLDIVAAAEPTPGVPPSPAELAALVQRMRESGVRIVLADAHAHPSLVQALAARSGARVVTMQPSVPAHGPTRGDYIAFIDDNVRRLAETLVAR